MWQTSALYDHAAAFAGEVWHIALILGIATAVFAPLEYFFAVRRSRFFYQGWRVDLGWYVFSGLTLGFVLGPITATIAWAAHAALPSAMTGAASALPLWARMIGAMIVGEVGFYWGHRWTHTIPVLWQFHAVHHSAGHVGFLVNTRGHPVDVAFTRACGLTMLYAFGFADTLGPDPALIPALVVFAGSFWTYFIHSNVKVRLGFLEEVIATPFFHHWHHTREDHKDRNYASMVPVMDRIFGTMYRPKEWPAEYGTATPVPDNLVGQLLQPFAPPPVPAATIDRPGVLPPDR